MSRVNPVVLIQMMLKYHYDAITPTSGARTFTFMHNHRMTVHKESTEEVQRRKSHLNSFKLSSAKMALKESLKRTLAGRLGKVWIAPGMERIAVPLTMSTGETGYGVLPTGSHIPIPNGQFVRAFTYWEKVNDIDLSCIGLDCNGNQTEFSWRTMPNRWSGAAIVFSGDQTSGYNGGSEYYDIDIEAFKKTYPNIRYIVLCNNVYTHGGQFNECDCIAGFMIRDKDPNQFIFKGERGPVYGALSLPQPVIFDPKTVETSFRITSESSFVYLFALDLEAREMIWLNLARSGSTRVAGATQLDFLKRYFTITDVINLRDLYAWSGTVVDDPTEADVVVSDKEINGLLKENCDWVASWDFEKILKFISS